MSAAEHLDVLIVGAGLSGIDMGYRLQTECPGKRYAILEARDAIGGTWDLFRYPGVRSDSDMYTLGFPFRPWGQARPIADGAAIRDYIAETAAVFGIDRHIRFGHRVSAASWSSDAARWTIDLATRDGPRRITCEFLYLGSGYYDYSAGYTPDLPDADRFGGALVHPQFWPADLDVAGKRVVVIGSGATAVTLVPALAETAASVTMLQRSPTYIVARPGEDRIVRAARRALPARLAAGAARWKSIALGIAGYAYARRAPDRMKALILRGVRVQLPPGYEIESDFEPRYAPWDQRICLAPDGDIFAAIRSGRAEVVTDTIAQFTADGIRLASGRDLPADIVVTATGLVLQLFGGIAIEVDGRRIDAAKHLSFKGAMLSDVPNLALAFGYTNASWTLKCDLTARYVCRLLRYMDRKGYAACTPRVIGDQGDPEPMLDFTSGYVQRAAAILPRQGAKAPWRVHQNYVRDLMAFTFGKVADPALRFTRRQST